MGKFVLILGLALLFTSGCERGNLTTPSLISEDQNTVIQENALIQEKEQENKAGDVENIEEPITENGLPVLEDDDGSSRFLPDEAALLAAAMQTGYIASNHTEILNASASIAPEEGKEPAAIIPWQLTIESDMPYMVEVDVTNKIVTVFGQDENGDHIKIVRQMICSVGKPDRPTLLGTFTIPETERVDRLDWVLFPSGVWARYFVRIDGPYLFHSIPYRERNINSVIVDEFYNLGKAVSLGCVRLLVVDARWVYENIQPGTVVKITEKPVDPYLTKWFDPICISTNAEDATFPFPESIAIEGFGDKPVKVGDEITFAAFVRFDDQTALDKTLVVDWGVENEESVVIFGNVIRMLTPGTVKISARYRHLETQIEVQIVEPESQTD